MKHGSDKNNRETTIQQTERPPFSSAHPVTATEQSAIPRDGGGMPIRSIFWVIGILVASFMAYTTRYFINGDAIAYIEMGEALRTGEWIRLANLTYSPGYPFLLGIGQVLLDTNPMNELFRLRIVNVICFLITLAGCELFLGQVRKSAGLITREGWEPLPGRLLDLIWYAAFLAAGLVLIRIRLMNPDMLVFATVLFGSAVILWIGRDPEPYSKYAILGLVSGLGYLVKSFFFPFSAALFLLAGLSARSFRKALPRVTVAIVVMLVAAGPLVAALSSRLGRFTYGELGRHVYATLISGKGTPIHPEKLNSEPSVRRFLYDVTCTHPSGFDICYWHEGLGPDFNVGKHLKIIPGNVGEIFTQTPWLALIGVWFIVLWWIGAFRFAPLWPPSAFGLSIAVAAAGIGLYSLVRMEPRYIAPYLFVGFVGLTLCLGYPTGDRRVRRFVAWMAGVFAGFALLLVGHATVDQTLRTLHSTEAKLSYRDQFQELVSVNDYLRAQGLKKGDYAAVAAIPPMYWARIAGLRVVAEIDSSEEFLNSTPEKRMQALQSLRKSGIKAVVTRDRLFERLKSEGWQSAPGTREFYVMIL